MEVAPWSEGKRHLNFSQRYRKNQALKESKATYGLATGQLRAFTSGLHQATDFAKQADHPTGRRRGERTRSEKPFTALYESR